MWILPLALAVCVLLVSFGIGTASGAGESDDSTLGLGSQRQTLDIAAYSFNPAEELGIEALPEGADALREPIQIAANDNSGPVVALAAVDLGDQATVEAAAEIGVLDPPEGVPTKPIDTSGEGWLVGQASGYDIESSSTITRSGRAFDDDCVTVAVPEGQEELLGHPVIIVYGDRVVVATVTDTGGFAKYGRVLDLGGGVFKALGHEDIWEWGVREVHYKFL